MSWGYLPPKLKLHLNLNYSLYVTSRSTNSRIDRGKVGCSRSTNCQFDFWPLGRSSPCALVLVLSDGSSIGFQFHLTLDHLLSSRSPHTQLRLQPLGCLAPLTSPFRLVGSCRSSTYLLLLVRIFFASSLIHHLDMIFYRCGNCKIHLLQMSCKWSTLLFRVLRNFLD